MQGSYATALLKQQQLPESFQFYFKQKQHLSNTQELHQLHELVRPRLKIAIVTETWPPEINGVALSLLQLCQGLQKQGHKILLVRPEQKPNVMIFARTRMSGDVTSDSKISNFAIWLAPIFKSFKSF